MSAPFSTQEQLIVLDWRRLPILMNRIPYFLLRAHERYIVSRGGAGSGKSDGHAQKIVFYTSNEKGHNTLVVRKVMDTNRHSTFSTIVYWIGAWNLGDLFYVRESDLYIRCIPNGNEIIFKGMDDPEKLKSIRFKQGVLTDVWMEEATEFTQEDFETLDLRLRGLNPYGIRYQMTLTFNPVDSLHWIKAYFYDNKVDNCKLVHSTYKDNRFLDKQYVDTLNSKCEKSPYIYQVYAQGEWGCAEDLVFNNVRYETINYKWDDFDAVYVGQDFGYDHYNAIELIGRKENRYYSFDELYIRNMTNAKIIAENERRALLPKGKLCTCDTASPGSIQDWKDAGYRVIAANKGPDSVRRGLSFLSDIEWIVDPTKCPGLTAEIKGFMKRKDKKTGVTLEIDEARGFRDDAIAACRYAIESLLEKRGAFEVY